MAHHALLVGVGDGSFLKLGHFGIGRLDLRLHFREVTVRKIHPAYVERQIKGVDRAEVFLVPIPECLRIHDKILQLVLVMEK